MADYIEGAIKEHLEAVSAVTNICSTRIYWLKAPTVAVLPYIMFFTVSDQHQGMYFDPAGTRTKAGQRLMQFTCISDRNKEAANLQHQVMDRLRGTTGSVYGFTVEGIFIENMRQRIDPDTKHYLCDVDARVEYYEA